VPARTRSVAETKAAWGDQAGEADEEEEDRRRWRWRRMGDIGVVE
jgi:hypothetical protein